MTSSTNHRFDSLKSEVLDDSASDDIEWMDKWIIRFIKAVAITLAVLVVGGCFSVVVPIGKHALTYEKTPDSSASRTTRNPVPPQAPRANNQSDFSSSSKDINESQQNNDAGTQNNQQDNNTDNQNQENNSNPDHDYTEDLKSAGGEIGNNLKKAGEQAVDKGKQAGKSAGEWLKQKWNSAGDGSDQDGNPSSQSQEGDGQGTETDGENSGEQPAPQNDPSQNQ